MYRSIHHQNHIELKVETPPGRKRYIQALQQADVGDYKRLEKLITEAISEAIKELRKVS